MELGPGMEWDENAECENTPGKQESDGLSFFETRNCSWNVALCSSQVWQVGIS